MRALGFLAMLCLGACRGQAQDRPATYEPGTRKEAKLEVVETVFDSGLKEGWQDYGWAPRELETGGPAQLKMANWAGWIIAKPGLKGRFGGVLLRYKAPKDFGDFLEVRVESIREQVFPRVNVGPQHRRELEDGWTEVFISISELNPKHYTFDRLILRPHKKVGDTRVLFDKIALTKGQARPDEVVQPAQPATFAIQCLSKPQPINPQIYGIAFDPMKDLKEQGFWKMSSSARRWGGNPASTYNWELGNAWNTGNDWYFENVNFTGDPKFTYDTFLEENLLRGVQTALTLPIMGWVAKDTTSHSFPTEVFGKQRAEDPYRPGAGDGFKPDGKPITPGSPTRTSVPSTPEMVGRWVRAIRKKDKARGQRSVHMYILDNEPMLWNSTHRDVHPEPVSYDELLKRTIDYGTVVRAEDPEAVIAGPALWGWPAYSFSAVDAEAGFHLKPDRLRHGNVPLLAWYLKKLAELEKKEGKRILDVVDVHFYPMAQGVGHNEGATDPETSALRIRSTRALWDPSYVDESWIKEPVRLIPRLKEWIAENYPGRGIAIGEWNFGAEEHMSGGLAVAEVLGRFGQMGVTAAYYWTHPPENSAVFWAFRAYRNFDGKGARFESQSLTTQAPANTALYASKNEHGSRYTALALNFSPNVPLNATLKLDGCTGTATRRTYVYTGGEKGFAPGAAGAVESGKMEQLLPPYSMTVFEIQMGNAPQ